MMCRRAALVLAGVTVCAGMRRKAAGDNERDCFSKYDGQALLKVNACTQDVAESIEELMVAGGCTNLNDEGLALLTRHGCSSVEAICPETIAQHLSQHFRSNVVVESEDAGEYLRATTPNIEPLDGVQIMGVHAESSFYSAFRGLKEQEERVESAVRNSGGAAVLEKVGSTHEGRSVKAVRITGQGYSPGKPRVVMTFNAHAREWVAGMSGVYAVEMLAAKARDQPNYFYGMEVVIIPMVNPDGFYYSTTQERMWRKNRAPRSGWFGCAGVDLNRNFPLGWGGPYSTSSNSCSDVYYGSGPLSEPESKAVAKVIDEKPVTVFIDTHCYGRYILKPWSYTNDRHPRNAEVDDLGNRMFKAIKSSRNNRFQYGGNELLGRASGVIPDYANGGLGYTFELTTAFNPPASDILPSAVECLDGIYAAIDWSKTNR